MKTRKRRIPPGESPDKPVAKKPAIRRSTLGKSRPSKAVDSPGYEKTPAKKPPPRKATPVKITLAKETPVKAAPEKANSRKTTPAKVFPVKITPVKYSAPKATPAKETGNVASAKGKSSTSKETPAKVKSPTVVLTTPTSKRGRKSKDVTLPFSKVAISSPQVKKPENAMFVGSAKEKPTTTAAEKIIILEKERAGPQNETDGEHNYSKDPKDELMKLNLPIYACSVCKRYTVDPQQSSYHARMAHDGKVGVMLMLPLPNIEIPKPTPHSRPGVSDLPPTNPVTSPARGSIAGLLPNPLKSPMTNAVKSTGVYPVKSSLTTPNKHPKITSVANPATELDKTTYECEKCDRHFDRPRQMNMHKCLEPFRRKPSPRRGESSPRRGGSSPRQGEGILEAKSPGKQVETVVPMSTKEHEQDKAKDSNALSSPAKKDIVQNEVINSTTQQQNNQENQSITEDPVEHINNLLNGDRDDSDSVGSQGASPLEIDDDEDGVPPTLGVHLSKSIPPSDRRGTWMLCKTRDKEGWKWEAQKVADAPLKRSPGKEKEKSEPAKVNKKSEQTITDEDKSEHGKADVEKYENGKTDKEKNEHEKADEDESESSKADDKAISTLLPGNDEDDYEFGEDDYAEDEEDQLDPPPVGADKSVLNEKTAMNSDVAKYRVLSDKLEDDMVKQWINKAPPTKAEIQKYIKVVKGGLQSTTGQALEFFMCLICRRVFKTKNVMRPHIYAHIGYRPYDCGQCGFSAPHHAAWKVHIQKHADNELKCWHGQCAFVGTSREDLDEHRLVHAPALSCALCGVKFKGQSTILGHLYINHQDEIKEGKGKDFYTAMATAGRSRSQIVLFECDICGKKYKTKRSYYTHIKTDHAEKSQEKSVKNGEDGKNVRCKAVRKRSRRAARKPVKMVTCPMCGLTCHSESKLKSHLNSHPFVYRCCMCEEKFLTYGALNEHVGLHRGQEEGEFNPQEKINESLRRSIYLAGQMDKALEADKVQWAQRRTGAEAPKSAMTGSIFDDLMSKISIPTEDVSKEELQEIGEAFVDVPYKKLTPSILRYIHLRFGNVECGVCGKLFPKVGLCKDHTKKHTKAKDFRCTKCEFQGASKKTLERHLAKVHKEGELFHCAECNIDIIGGDMFKHHMRRHAKENEGPYTCTWCNTVEDRKVDMKNHIMNTHPMMPLAESTKIMGSGVVIHREKGAPFLVCEVCNETFRRICDLRRHMWKHSSVKRFTCDLCDYGSDKRGNIVSHMRKHTTEKQAACNVCGKMYKTMQSLKLHVRSAHLKLKPFKCDLCDYAASQPVHLRRHIVLHHTSGEHRKFRCAICPDYRATDLQLVKRHYKKKHPKEKMNLAKCCPPDAQNPSSAKKDKHQVIQVVPSLPAQSDAPVNSDMPVSAEGTQEMEQEQLSQPPDVDSAVIEVQTEHHQEMAPDMTVEVVLPEDQGQQLIDINSALPDVINALAALQESELNTQ